MARHIELSKPELELLNITVKFMSENELTVESLESINGLIKELFLKDALLRKADN